jgi:hypothetical protein
MPIRIRAFAVIATLASCASPCVAQLAYDPKPIESLLESGHPSEQAWGAWYAGRLMMTDLVPALERAVETRLNSSSGLDATLDVAVDALIQLNAEPSPTLIMRIHERSPEAALVLLSRRRSDADEALKEILAKASSEEWFAAANLLRERKAPGFAALVLRDLVFTAAVNGWPGGSGGVGCACGGIGLNPGYPPWPTYRLSIYPRTALTVLAPGPRPVYYERRVASAGHTPGGDRCSSYGPRQEDRLALFEPWSKPMHINWLVEPLQKDKPVTDADVRRTMRDIQDRYRVLLNDLVRAGLLTADEARSLVPAKVRVER